VIMAQNSTVKSSRGNGSGNRFYKVQIKAWTNFDPSQADFRQIAEAVDDGSAVVTVQELIEAADHVTEIEDEDVRKRFELLQAADTLVQNLMSLPPALRDKLRAALQ
jgi:hypothetical protein